VAMNCGTIEAPSYKRFSYYPTDTPDKQSGRARAFGGGQCADDQSGLEHFRAGFVKQPWGLRSFSVVAFSRPRCSQRRISRPFQVENRHCEGHAAAFQATAGGTAGTISGKLSEVTCTACQA
jgi:hypothetical protein